MTQSWSHFFDGSPNYVWEQKLKQIKYALKSWVKKPLMTPLSSRQESVHALAEIQLSMEDSEITKPHLDREQSTQANYFLSFRQERVSASQVSQFMAASRR